MNEKPKKNSNPGEEATQVFARMRQLAIKDNTLPYIQRIRILKALRLELVSRKAELEKALTEDFGGRSVHESIMADYIPSLGNIDYTIKNLRKWMKPQKRSVALAFKPARNRIEFHPKGVVLIISPWNYPVSLSLVPLVTALAAGNRVILKPSECTPRTSQVLAELVAAALPEDKAVVLTGSPEIAAELCKLPFDHIMFTGSSAVGRKVMKAAAENLTPVTLELGGKSPAIIQPNFDLKKATERIVRGKFFNTGQTCISPDYVMIERGQVNDFIKLYEETVNTFYPKIDGNPDYTSIINDQHFKRLVDLIEDAEKKGADVRVIGQEKQRSSGERTLHPHIVLDMKDDMKIAQEEIFGPILPIVPFDTVEEASEYVNHRPRPLALYYFDTDSYRQRCFMSATISGGAAVNDTLMQFAQEELPFGGIGPSGMGVTHAFEGFKEFSHSRSVFYQGGFNTGSMLYPPYGKQIEKIFGPPG